MGRESSQALDRGLRLLELLAGSGEPLTVTSIAAGLGMARPVVYRLLAALEEHGLAGTDGAGRYRLGLGLLRFTERLLPLVRATAEPRLRTLAEEAAATAHLTLADGDAAVAVVVVEPASTTFHVAYRAGTRHPLTLGAAGKAILGGRRARSARWYVTHGELQEGATGLAVPLRHPVLEASVGVVSFGGLDLDVVGPAVVRTADALRADLDGGRSVHPAGGRTPPTGP